MREKKGHLGYLPCSGSKQNFVTVPDKFNQPFKDLSTSYIYCAIKDLLCSIIPPYFQQQYQEPEHTKSCWWGGNKHCQARLSRICLQHHQHDWARYCVIQPDTHFTLSGRNTHHSQMVFSPQLCCWVTYRHLLYFLQAPIPSQEYLCVGEQPSLSKAAHAIWFNTLFSKLLQKFIHL